MKQYKLVIFDLDGTLTPERTSSAAPFERRLLPNVFKITNRMWLDNIKLGIVTNQRHANEKDLEWLLDWIRKMLSPVLIWVCREDFECKPDPFGILRVLEKADCRQWETLMVGNSDTDQKAAIAAGVDFEWAKDFFGWKQEEK